MTIITSPVCMGSGYLRCTSTVFQMVGLFVSPKLNKSLKYKNRDAILCQDLHNFTKHSLDNPFSSEDFISLWCWFNNQHFKTEQHISVITSRQALVLWWKNLIKHFRLKALGSTTAGNWTTKCQTSVARTIEFQEL